MQFPAVCILLSLICRVSCSRRRRRRRCRNRNVFPPCTWEPPFPRLFYYCFYLPTWSSVRAFVNDGLRASPCLVTCVIVKGDDEQLIFFLFTFFAPTLSDVVAFPARCVRPMSLPGCSLKHVHGVPPIVNAARSVITNVEIVPPTA